MTDFWGLEIYQWTSPVQIGDNFRADCWFDHRGDAFQGRLYVAIGIKGVFFNELLAGESPLDLPATVYTRTEYKAVFIPITGIQPGVYDLYAKVFGEIVSPYYLDVVTIEGEVLGPAVFSNLLVSYIKV